MEREFLKSAEFNKENIIQNVLIPNGFNGHRAHADLRRLVREENTRRNAQGLALASNLGLVFSLYNLTRFSQLSPSGRPAAIGSTLFFALFSYTNLSRAGWFGRQSSAAPAQEEKKQ